MKTFFSQLVLVAVILVSMISISYGDLVVPDYAVTNASLETLQINDNTTDTNGDVPNPLYRIFNEYFSEELGALDQSNYTSGNELADERMIRQTISSWQVNSGSNVVASFTSSAWTHGLQIYSTTGNLLFDTGQYGSTTNGEAFIDDGQQIPLVGGNYTFSANTNGQSKVFSGDHEWYYSSDEYQSEATWTRYYEDGVQHLIAFDVTDLMKQRVGDENVESAFLFAFEDLPKSGSDFDYQDFAFILTNVSANVVPSVVPEPATALILGFVGTLALPFLKRKKKVK
ncbi:MAG: PEP-CTERM sorting domain-containing protein [Planctomycetaceae bacterium]|jgi:hypothetical protein|nr:PEP-CTERM sorting domain-containing protein [Planctomycetaceae bacterium]